MGSAALMPWRWGNDEWVGRWGCDGWVARLRICFMRSGWRYWYLQWYQVSLSLAQPRYALSPSSSSSSSSSPNYPRHEVFGNQEQRLSSVMSGWLLGEGGRGVRGVTGRCFECGGAGGGNELFGKSGLSWWWLRRLRR